MNAEPVEQGSRPASATDRTRIPIPARRVKARADNPDLALSDAVDFWSFAGAAANVIMQLSWPEVGYGVVESRVESGSLMHHPWKRARTTTQYLAVAILGTEEERAAYRDAVNGAHRQVRSHSGSPVAYNAFDRTLQMWVAACLYVGFEDTYELLHGRLTGREREHFYSTAMPLGTTLQVTEEQWPPTRAEFDDYWNSACQRIDIDDRVRDYLLALVNLEMVRLPLRITFAPLLRLLTVGTLAPVFRDAMGLDWSERDQRRFERLFVLVAAVNRMLPRFVRHGATHVLMGDVRRRIRRRTALI